MKNTKKIGWQKYEDYVEKQLTSPILTNILQNIVGQNTQNIDDDEDDEDEDYLDISDEKMKAMAPILPITNQLIDDISMLSSSDCWMGHTNFDITQSIKNTLNKIPGVEILKICSRYRFFVGIGRMFDFKDVRQHIEDSLLEGD